MREASLAALLLFTILASCGALWGDGNRVPVLRHGPQLNGDKLMGTSGAVQSVGGADGRGCRSVSAEVGDSLESELVPHCLGAALMNPPTRNSIGLSLRLRGGLRTRHRVYTRIIGKGKKSKEVPREIKVKKKQPAHNLPPDGWRDKIKNKKNLELQRKEYSGKGRAKGRTRAVFHFWTKTKIKTFIAKRRKHQAFARKQVEAKQIRNYNKGEHRHTWKWLLSEVEQAAQAALEAEKAPPKKAKKSKKEDGDEEDGEEEEAGDAEGEEGEGEGGVGGGGGGGDEDEFMFPGVSGDEEGGGGGGKAAANDEPEEEFMFPGMDSDPEK